MIPSPRLPEVIQQAIDANLVDVHTSMPGKVVSYDAAKQVADVRPLLKRALFNADGEKDVEELPILPAVPVAWLRGGGFYIHMPLAAGDGVEIIFGERDISAALDTGEPSDPGDVGRHTMAGAVAVPGLETVARRLAGADISATELIIGKEGGPQIRIDGSFVKLGKDAAQYVALANLVDARFAAIHDALAGVTPAAPSGPDAGEPGLIALQAALHAAFATVAATKAKAE